MKSNLDFLKRAIEYRITISVANTKVNVKSSGTALNLLIFLAFFQISLLTNTCLHIILYIATNICVYTLNRVI